MKLVKERLESMLLVLVLRITLDRLKIINCQVSFYHLLFLLISIFFILNVCVCVCNHTRACVACTHTITEARGCQVSALPVSALLP